MPMARKGEAFFLRTSCEAGHNTTAWGAFMHKS